MVAYLAGAVLSAQGVTALDLALTGKGAVDAAFVSLAGALGGVGVLAVTPLTDAYGVGKELSDADLDEDIDLDADLGLEDIDLDSELPTNQGLGH